ncbi:cryptochrome/photolyase family protein [Rhodobacteraceae bacterium RKSG542]|uniref:cryptochrome/photolyase family protein n=1 Tax=Pseudovibrio flavus TaxID=2529854 RepID=UPI0012BC6717|nr:cryptochrome/photolyase family protein [Pseudovibrio flavus]MTI16230.1 cryptochrome/photolyase family protein [Pseudovibrio flavus]
MARLIVVLGDQLTHSISSLSQASKADDVVLMAEPVGEATYVRHHKKKIAFILSAMRHFAQELKDDGWTVHYRATDERLPSFTAAVEAELQAGAFESITICEAGEWRVQEEIDSWEQRFGLPVTVLKDSRFLASKQDFAQWAEGRKALRMEYFYREMRRKTGLLMEGDKPAGGKWNFDSDNRKPAKADLFMPRPIEFTPDAITQNVLSLVDQHYGDHFGSLEPFWFAVRREQALAALDHFIETALPEFGTYQDAMLTGERFLYHSVLSLYLNVGLLEPMEVCRRTEEAYLVGRVPINAAEGFIRQIIGWREYIRGFYWLQGPDYGSSNFFGASRPLPEFYWSGDTNMVCLREAITQTKEEAYAHHIQRLMVTGNFAMLAGIDPHAVHEWYLAVYADAFEWVEMPNTLGMSQFADGGLLASKPYAGSGRYIDRMSDYCQHCVYDPAERTGEKACPFNALYWDFLERNREVLAGNPRLGPIFATWGRMADEKRAAVLSHAAALLNKLDAL